MKKSTTAFEGMLPIEGDEIFKGAQRRVEEIRQFKSNRPRSLFGGSVSDRGDA